MFASMAANSGATGSRTISSQLGQEDRTISFFGRANYSLMDRYLLTFTIRADGSSKFTKGNRWGYFPAAAFAWRIIEEPFMEPVKEFMSNLKLRLSYGTAGNNRIGNSLYETSYKAYSSGKYYGAGGEQNPHYTLNNEQLANPDLKWETTITRNIGLDFGFFNERLTGNIDYYWNTVKDHCYRIQNYATEHRSNLKSRCRTDSECSNPSKERLFSEFQFQYRFQQKQG